MNIFIIAEIGINHNGDLNLAKKMIKTAKNCGANAVKFQKRDINLVYSKELLNEKGSPGGKLNTTKRWVWNLKKKNTIK